MTEKVNIRTIAQLAGCSPATVSRVLSGRAGSIQISEATREKLLAICEELDYHPSIHAGRFFSKRSRVIGFLLPDRMPPGDQGLSRALLAVCAELSNCSYRCLPLLCDEFFQNNEEYLNVFKRREIDALIVWGVRAEYTFPARLTAERRPFLLLQNRMADYPAIYPAQRQASRELTAMAIRRGARRLLSVTIDGSDSFAARLQGFLDAAAGIGHQVLTISSGEELRPETEAFRRILHLHPDAIIAPSDTLAIRLEESLLEAGVRIPEEVMIAGGDDIFAAAHCRVPLTTFGWNWEEAAALCASMLIEHLEHGAPLESRELPTRIVWRDSLPQFTETRPVQSGETAADA